MPTRRSAGWRGTTSPATANVRGVDPTRRSNGPDSRLGMLLSMSLLYSCQERLRGVVADDAWLTLPGDQVVTLAIGGELMGGCPAHMVMTNFPRARPECRSRMASGTPPSGYVLSMTGITLPASMSFFRSCKSSDFALAMTIRIRWLTNGDSASARIERPMAPPINRPPPSPPTSTTADWGLRCHELVSFDPMGHVARRTLYKRLPYKVWECYRLETQS